MAGACGSTRRDRRQGNDTVGAGERCERRCCTCGVGHIVTEQWRDSKRSGGVDGETRSGVEAGHRKGAFANGVPAQADPSVARRHSAGDAPCLASGEGGAEDDGGDEQCDGGERHGRRQEAVQHGDCRQGCKIQSPQVLWTPSSRAGSRRRRASSGGRWPRRGRESRVAAAAAMR